METLPIDTSKAMSSIVEQGALFSFMLLVLIVLLFIVRTLYLRNIKQGDDFQKAFIDSTIAINNNTQSASTLATEIKGLARQIELMNVR